MKNTTEIKIELKSIAIKLKQLLSNVEGFLQIYYLETPDEVETLCNAYHFYAVFENQAPDCYDFNNHIEASSASNRLKKKLLSENGNLLPFVITFSKKSIFDELIKESDSLAHRCFYHGVII